jgi:hypothetical protein
MVSKQTTYKLSDRIRPNSEAAPWVIEEIKKLEAKLADMKDKIGLIKDFLNILQNK